MLTCTAVWAGPRILPALENLLHLIWSDDQGATWSADPMVCAVTPPFHDHEIGTLASGLDLRRPGERLPPLP